MKIPKIKIPKIPKIPGISKRSKLTLVVLLILFFYILLRLVRPPIPSSLLKVYMFFIIITILLYVTSREEWTKDLMAPIKATLVEPGKRLLRNVIFVVFPLIAALITYGYVRPSYEAPVEIRSIHPAPPSSMSAYNKSYNLNTLKNPLRDDTANYAKYVREGGEVYFKNCFYCHGDKLDAKGHFNNGFNPLPANFQDVGTIAQLQESFLFWRIATGGPGLPREGAPWLSAMPIWENFISEEDTWKVIMFMYDYTGHKPRTF